MSILQHSGTDFFLTGGTALSRAYYNHRYSDDLDFFVNQSPAYDDQLDKVLALLRENGYIWDIYNEYTRARNFTTLKVRKDSDTLLKLDFVNDLVPHYGEIIETDLFYRTDSIRNMLSNKLSAIFRYAAKDIADIREIALHETVDWPTVINEARNKEAGLELIYISEILTSMPESEFETITWTKKPGWQEFRNDIDRIVYEMMSGEHI
ncbi:MAG: nucleotidyl transferase AbiEii/AbiGii toxin family protein [Treponema sp.]|jgi:predicted nucleotidyltransferase component of viral defense system|nr:nucleotidyl transferase AbiEii/AbiGii toxin family protein [Treponema sp.]